MKKWVFTLILFLLLIPKSVFATELRPNYNYSCSFEEVKYLEYSLEFKSLGEFYPYLVQESDGLTAFKIVVSDNLEELGKELRASYRTICDGNYILSAGGPPTSIKNIIYNGSESTEISWVTEVDVPTDAHICIVKGILGATNETFFSEYPCSDCSQLCYVRGLSGIVFEGERQRVLTKDVFFNLSELKQQKKHLNWLIISVVFLALGTTGNLMLKIYELFFRRGMKGKIKQIKSVNDLEFKLSMGFAITVMGLSMSLFGFDRLGLVSIPVAWVYAIFGIIIMFVGSIFIIFKVIKKS